MVPNDKSPVTLPQRAKNTILLKRAEMANRASRNAEQKIAQVALAQILIEIDFGSLLEPRRDRWAIQRGVNRTAFLLQ
jgi:hypothetical protein